MRKSPGHLLHGLASAATGESTITSSPPQRGYLPCSPFCHREMPQGGAQLKSPPSLLSTTRPHCVYRKKTAKAYVCTGL